MARLRMALATSKDHQDSEPNFYTCLPNTEYYITAVFLGRINFKSPPLYTNVSTDKKRNDVCDNDVSMDIT